MEYPVILFKWVFVRWAYTQGGLHAGGLIHRGGAYTQGGLHMGKYGIYN